MIQHELRNIDKVEARKRVYSALGEVNRLLANLDIVPNMRDYPDFAAFDVARKQHTSHMRKVVELQNEMTREAKILQTGGIL